MRAKSERTNRYARNTGTSGFDDIIILYLTRKHTLLLRMYTSKEKSTAEWRAAFCQTR